MRSLKVLQNDRAQSVSEGPDTAAKRDGIISQAASDLRGLIRGEVRFGQHDRSLYSTDASLYQVEPIGVVIPANIDDLVAAARYCASKSIPILPRGGGTSLAGQCTNHAVVIDASAFCREIVSIDPDRETARVEPGMTIGGLNRQLRNRGHNLFFAPDPATIDQATIGGCIGNNAAGARSIFYGRTSENINGVEVLLAGGERLWLEPGAGSGNPKAHELAAGVIEIVKRNAKLIRERFPKTIRRNAGYSLDVILAQIDAGATAETLDLSQLICGSEGTLAIVLGANLKLHRVPKARQLAIASFASLDAAVDAVSAVVATRPCAVELLDDVVLAAAAVNNECRKYIELLPKIDGDLPKAALYIEYQAIDDPEELDGAFERLSNVLVQFGAKINLCREQDEMLQAWSLRKAAEPLLHALPGKRKPVTFVEDNAVPVENLSRFVREFRRIVAEHGTTAAYYAHASVGVLHIRPLIDLHDDQDRQIMRSIAIQAAELARECGGVMSGEHGDGRVRGPLLERFFGSELMQAFRQVKHLFDPQNLLNPGNIVSPGPIESITQNLRLDHEWASALKGTDTYFEYLDQHNFQEALEMCNGAGVCRKQFGGTMCPSYRATLDERHCTRGRANALRTAILGTDGNEQRSGPNWNDSETLSTLDLCLSCKACKTECPSNVDIARLKAEYLAQSYKSVGGPPMAARAFGHIRLLNQIGSIMPGVANWLGRKRLSRKLLNSILGIASERHLPEFDHSLYRWFGRRQKQQEPSGPSVVLYADCFSTYNETRVGKAAVALLETMGYTVLLPKVGCCGRAMISTGLLGDAIATIDRTIEHLRPFVEDEGTQAILVMEPSCLSAMTDEWLQLKLQSPIELRRRLANKVMLVEDFLERQWDSHPHRPDLNLIRQRQVQDVFFHGHCHQKALWGQSTSVALLHRLMGDHLHVLDSGCCGMAGSFGYFASKYKLSMRIGELSVFPPLRLTSDDAIICAPGTSCRHQIHDGTGRRAVHPIELVHDLVLASRKS